MKRKSTLLLLWAALLLPEVLPAEETTPVHIGFDGEYGLKNSTSAQAIEQGLRVAIHEINAAGGVLGGRPLELITRDNRSVPARGLENLRRFAEDPELVAVVGGRFSPVILQQLELLHQLELPLLDAWGSADGITDHAHNPSYTFRLSLRDRYAMPFLLRQALAKGARRVALMVPNTGWGRSNVAAAQAYVAEHPEHVVTRIHWYNWGDKEYAAAYQELLASGAEALLLVANDTEGARIVREVAAQPPQRRLPILSHWGVTGGRFVEATGAALGQVDFSVIQTFSFARARPEVRERVLKLAAGLFGIAGPEQVTAPVGFGHAYDLAHLLARAIELAGTSDRRAVRDALERVRGYRGLVRDYDHPFPPEDHNALGPEQLFMAVYRDGAIVPLGAE